MYKISGRILRQIANLGVWITHMAESWCLVWEVRESSQGALVVKSPPANARDLRDVGSIPGSGRSPGEENSNPLQYSCLENPTDRGAWWATVHCVKKSWTRRRDEYFHFSFYLSRKLNISEGTDELGVRFSQARTKDTTDGMIHG